MFAPMQTVIFNPRYDTERLRTELEKVRAAYEGGAGASEIMDRVEYYDGYFRNVYYFRMEEWIHASGGTAPSVKEELVHDYSVLTGRFLDNAPDGNCFDSDMQGIFAICDRTFSDLSGLIDGNQSPGQTEYYELLFNLFFSCMDLMDVAGAHVMLDSGGPQE
jgi:hypothetical protein